MPDLRDAAASDWGKLPVWVGLDVDDADGTEYRGTFRGRTYVITVNRREDGSAYSTSEEVNVT